MQHPIRGLGDHLSIGERIAFYRKRRGYTQEVLAGLVGRSTDWLAKIETGRRKPPRIDMLAELSRILRVPLGDLLGQTVLMEDERQQDDVPAVPDTLMSPRRLSRLLFVPDAEAQLPTPVPVAVRVEQAWNDYQGGRLGSVIAALPALPQTAQELEERAARRGDDRGDCWAVPARTHHLAATTLAKIGESDISWLAAERAMRAADESDDPLVPASAARSGTHALLANGRYDDALELGNTAAAWLSSQVTDHNPAALSLLGMIHLHAAVAAARHQDRPTATALLYRAEALADDLGSDENCWQTGFGPTNVLLHDCPSSSAAHWLRRKWRPGPAVGAPSGWYPLFTGQWRFATPESAEGDRDDEANCRRDCGRCAELGAEHDVRERDVAIRSLPEPGHGPLSGLRGRQGGLRHGVQRGRLPDLADQQPDFPAHRAAAKRG
ncbi:helix-turn-helix domain-containing protein [Streptomyces sp. NPDC001307]|uniref:helix-turn-helix domain-containing protein n=1 Tax=Streptomyces sp. NPDC001307 TaxID=3364560 RepID=UPI00368299DE